VLVFVLFVSAEKFGVDVQLNESDKAKLRAQRFGVNVLEEKQKQTQNKKQKVNKKLNHFCLSLCVHSTNVTGRFVYLHMFIYFVLLFFVL
jgi:hypothetical protein